MAVEIITKQDLEQFRSELLKDLKQILQPENVPATSKWLKSTEVKDQLKISAGTLQSLRVSGVLSYTRIGGIFYYNQDDIQKLLNENKTPTRN